MGFVMKLIDIYNESGTWSDKAYSNTELGVSYFKPIFCTSDGLAIGVDNDGHGLEFSTKDNDGWEEWTHKSSKKFYKLLEVYSLDDKKYVTVFQKSWKDNVDQIIESLKGKNLLAVKILEEEKPITWDGEPIIVTNNTNSQKESSGSELNNEDDLDI
jgi:hypothetical protein